MANLQSTRRVQYAPGTNVHASYTLPEARVVGYGTSTTNGADPVNRLSVTGAAKIKGITKRAIAPGATGDVADDGVEEVESDGSGTIERGDRLAARTAADATEGRVYSLRAEPPTAGTNVHVVGIAEDPAAATAGVRVRCRLTVGASLNLATS